MYHIYSAHVFGLISVIMLLLNEVCITNFVKLVPNKLIYSSLPFNHFTKADKLYPAYITCIVYKNKITTWIGK